MKSKRIARGLTALMLIAGSAVAFGAESNPQMMPGMHGMMGPGAHGMMMNCPMAGPGMMGGRMGPGMMPMLPPGNEKLQMQMHAEIMQKVGEIVGKYAEKLR